MTAPTGTLNGSPRVFLVMSSSQPIRHQDSRYFGLELLGLFRVVYYVIFSYFSLSMNLESFGTFWDQLGFISMECQHRGSER